MEISDHMAALSNGHHEKLAQELGKGLPQADAYLNAGFPSKNRASAAVQCNKLVKKHPEITARADELKTIARNEITVDDFKGDMETLTRMYLEDRMFAQQCGQPGAAVSATNGLAKLFGQGGENVNLAGKIETETTLKASPEAIDLLNEFARLKSQSRPDAESSDGVAEDSATGPATT